MKQLSLLALSLCSSGAMAVVNGTPVDWSSHDNTVKVEGCTGTLVAGNYVLTAGHCFGENEEYLIVSDANGSRYTQLEGDIETYFVHPNFVSTLVTEDVALVKMSQPVDFRHIQFFKDLNEPTFVEGEVVTINGFGGTDLELNRAELQLDSAPENYPFSMQAIQIMESYLTYGDSGSAWVDSNNDIVGISQGKSFDESLNLNTAAGIDLHYARDFLLEHIDSWHYPTVADVNGRAVIEVQSMHVSGVTDSAYVSGDATLIAEESSCVGATLEAFERCTYVIESNGGAGQLHLSEDEVVKINPSATSSSAKSGASLGIWSGLGLFVIGFIRRRTGL